MDSFIVLIGFPFTTFYQFYSFIFLFILEQTYPLSILKLLVLLFLLLPNCLNSVTFVESVCFFILLSSNWFKDYGMFYISEGVDNTSSPLKKAYLNFSCILFYYSLKD